MPETSNIFTNTKSRFLIGTALYPSLEIMKNAVIAANSSIITLSLRRQNDDKNNDFWQQIQSLPVKLLPNTAGCYNAKDAINTANMAREIFNTNWVKLEVIGDDYTQQPCPFGLVEAAIELNKQGFKVFPYCTYDIVLGYKLLEAGCDILMPWASPIGSGQGIMNPFALRLMREKFADITMIVDAGIGCPSDAALAMEMGFDGVLINSAVALAQEPEQMAKAFSLAVESGRLAYLSGRMPKRDYASPSTPTVGTPFWHKS